MERRQRSDPWASGDHYEQYVGRWSRPVAREFLRWIDAPPALDWIDVGCGTGALTDLSLESQIAAKFFRLRNADGSVAFEFLAGSVPVFSTPGTLNFASGSVSGTVAGSVAIFASGSIAALTGNTGSITTLTGTRYTAGGTVAGTAGVFGTVTINTAQAVYQGGALGTPASGTLTNCLGAVPIGGVMPYAGTAAPTGWLLCYGQAVSRSTYSDLFAIISTTYGVGDGSTTFNLPDLRGRVVAGQDDMGGVSADRLTDQSGGLDGDTLGDTGGSETHTLTTTEIAAHTHTAGVSVNFFATGSGTLVRSTALTGNATGSTGGGASCRHDDRGD